MEYNATEAMVLAQFMKEIDEQGFSFIQQYFLDKGLKKFGNRGHAAAYKEVRQLNNRDTFKPLAIREMTPQEKRKAMEALLFLAEKQNGTIKGRQVYNGKPTQEWLSKEDAASPTVSLESIMLLAAIDAHKKRDNMTVDIPNAFIQMPLEQSDGNKQTIMKITGVLVDMLVSIDPTKYQDYVVIEKGRKTLYVQLL